MDWVFNKCSLERKDDIKCLLIKSFIEAFKLDAEAPRLKEFSVVLMILFQFSLHRFATNNTASEIYYVLFLFLFLGNDVAIAVDIGKCRSI